jgi:hypothetical protein
VSECRKCGRELSNQLSRERGYGPVCYEKHLDDLKKLQLELNFDSKLPPSMSAYEKHKVVSKILGLG